MSAADILNGLSITQMSVIGVGFIGNLLTFIVFSRKTFRKNSIGTYCRALAIFDSFTLPQLINFMLNKAFNMNFAAINDELCKMWIYLPIFYSSIPAWILVAFSLDKFLSMRRSSISILKKKWFQLAVVFGIVLFDVLLYIAVPIFIQRARTPIGVYYCSISTLSFFNVFMYVFAMESCLIPFVIMIVLSTLSIRMLVKSRKSVERTGKVDKERKSRDVRYAISSIAFNFVFVALKTPTLIYYILSANNLVSNAYFISVSILFFYLNSSNSFFVHMISNSLFRREVLTMLRLYKMNRVNVTNTTKSSTKPEQHGVSTTFINAF